MKFYTYKPKSFNLSGLNGISDETLEMHFKLYEGYVTNTNEIQELISGLVTEDGVDKEKLHFYSELKRRLGFEFNGMVLHEYYFGNMKKNGGGDPRRDSAFRRAIDSGFQNYELWKADFTSAGNMRGIGWVICLRDPFTGNLSNHWINDHEVNNIAGFEPILVMDLWEHAYLLDYKPAEKEKYVDAFFSNIDWAVVEDRVSQSKESLAGAR